MYSCTFLNKKNLHELYAIICNQPALSARLSSFHNNHEASPVLWQVFDRLVVDFAGSGLTCMSKWLQELVMFCDLPKKHQRNPLWDGWSFDIICIDNAVLWFHLPTRKDSDLITHPLCCFDVFDCFLSLVMEHQSCKQWGWNRRALQSSEPECHTSRTCPSSKWRQGRQGAYEKQHNRFCIRVRFLTHSLLFIYLNTGQPKGNNQQKDTKTNDERALQIRFLKSLSLCVRAKTRY